MYSLLSSAAVLLSQTLELLVMQMHQFYELLVYMLLKLLDVCDPYVHEFFFGGRIVVVEGDTEYTAFSQLKLMYAGEYDDVHIIRARGKGVIPSVIKILNQFTADYGVLHDADAEL